MMGQWSLRLSAVCACLAFAAPALHGQDNPPADETNVAHVRWGSQVHGTGQPFNFDFFDRDDFVYDTELACRAVVTARGVEPRMGLSMLAQLHQAFYAENQDITDRDTVVAIAIDGGLDEAAFVETFDSDAAKQATASDFQITQKLGVPGFPTLLAGSYDEGFGLITTGYRPLQELAGPIAEWLEEKSD